MQDKDILFENLMNEYISGSITDENRIVLFKLKVMKNVFFVLVFVGTVFLGVANLALVKHSLSSIVLELASIDALAQSEASNCPQHKCDPGGCGSASCEIEMSYPFGFGSKKSVTAQNGYFACCYKDWAGDTFANCFPNSCCNGPVYY